MLCFQRVNSPKNISAKKTSQISQMVLSALLQQWTTAIKRNEKHSPADGCWQAHWAIGCHVPGSFLQCFWLSFCFILIPFYDIDMHRTCSLSHNSKTSSPGLRWVKSWFGQHSFMYVLKKMQIIISMGKLKFDEIT